MWAEDGETGATLGPHRKWWQGTGGLGEEEEGTAVLRWCLQGLRICREKQCAGPRFPVTNALCLSPDRLQAKGEC